MTNLPLTHPPFLSPIYLHIGIVWTFWLWAGLSVSVSTADDDPPPETQVGILVVEVISLPSSAGVVRAALWNAEPGFPSEVKRARRQAVAPIVDARSRIRFEGVPHGRWAISTYHDENANEELDRNFLGIPREAFGASNNKGGRFSAPKFSDALFEVTAPSQHLKIKLQRP